MENAAIKSDTHQLQLLLRQVGAWQSGHFLLASGLHSQQYVQCQKLLQYPRYGLVFAETLVEGVLAAGIKPRAVIGPALGAVHWELLVALALDRATTSSSATIQPIRGIFAERPEGKFEIRRGVEINPGEDVLVVEDVTTTGGSAREVVDLVRRLGGNPLAVGAIIDRSGGTAQFDLPFFSLIKLGLDTYPADACPLCAAGQALVKPGSKKK